MPPEAPEPRLMVVASSLSTNSRTRMLVAVMLLSRIDWMTP